MYAAVAGLLEGAGEQEPLLSILDDLHWADAPTLSLLHHVVASGSSMSGDGRWDIPRLRSLARAPADLAAR